MTFDPHPPRIVRPDKAPPLLMTKAQKLEALAAPGMHGAAIVRFTPELSRWDPEMFVRTVLVDWLHVAEVWVGANFLFGHDRGGNFSMLRTLGARYGFRAEKIDPVRYKEFVVSSTRIRRLVGEGRVDEAGALLGHQYYIDGTVVRGDQRGRDDRISDGESLHRKRAAAAARRLCDDGEDRRHRASVGHEHRRCGRPSTTRAAPSIETHIFDFNRDLYGQAIRVGFVQRLRDERAFESMERSRRRSTPTASARACCSIAFRCRIARRVPRRVPVRADAVRERRPRPRIADAMLADVMSAVLAYAGIRPDDRRGARDALRAAAQAGVGRRASRQANLAFRAHDGELAITIAARRWRRVAHDCAAPCHEADVRAAPRITMRLYNTLTPQEEAFAPARDNTVRMYTCGLTVYARGHIGNFRTFVCLDVLRRALKYLLRLRDQQVMNFTDVDDRTIAGAQKAGMALREYTDQYIAAFREDARRSGSRKSRRIRARPTRRTCGRWRD